MTMIQDSAIEMMENEQLVVLNGPEDDSDDIYDDDFDLEDIESFDDFDEDDDF